MDSFSVAINNRFGVLVDVNMHMGDDTPVQNPQLTTSGASENVEEQSAEKL